jgi:hypothetical protein
MRAYLQHISLVLLLVFAISNTGFAVYQHICYSSGTTGVSVLVPAFCEMEAEKEADNCCSKPESEKIPADDCCEHNSAFAKMDTDATLEKEQVWQLSEVGFSSKLFVFVLSNWLSNEETNLLLAALHPPNPHIQQPSSAPEHLAMVCSYLC